MIEVENLTKYYGPVPAIADLSFRVEKGEILGFLGPNAAGKTTTMRILTCFMPPTRGRARVAGYDCQEQSLEVRRHIGYLPENVPLYSEMRVSEYLHFVAAIKGIPRRDRAHRVAEVMGDCGVQEVAGKANGKLSKGYRQRVGLAQALLGDPEVLILDEPTVGLDPRQIIEIRNLIRSLGGRRTVILSTHILPEVGMTCQRVVIINEGRVVAVDTPENLTARLQKSAQVFLQIEGPPESVVKTLSQVEGVLAVERRDLAANPPVHTYLVQSQPELDLRKELAATVLRNQWGLLELRGVSLSLEDIFIQLVTEEEEAAANSLPESAHDSEEPEEEEEF
ncbi:MAG: ATP-binding cassette domain-containing protein [Candidatus Tectomicrobia bacterium]|uniref:ATP-binding cassette domain-containing protein n=1 Tax=Tectimicrobiota bacterium TaxID=2528274 RepID=A0A932FUE7_UNCTE|nr:ATP-binding cassette domain-containing protein [Candidatus Tectomicrobia bacterium]